jgi:hypothetical protein
MFGTGGTDSNVILWNSNLIDPEQEEEVLKVKEAHKASRRAMTGEEDVKIKPKTKRYTTKTSPIENKENQSDNTPYATLPEDLAGMMDKVVSQLDIVTRTVCLLEKRIGENEELVSEAYQAF